MATNYETVLVTKEKGITTITFNRPEKRNAMSPQFHREMFQLLTELRYDKETRAVVLTGAGDNFCAGQDLKQYALEMEANRSRCATKCGRRSAVGAMKCCGHCRSRLSRASPAGAWGVHSPWWPAATSRGSGRRAVWSARSQFRPFPCRRYDPCDDRESSGQARALLCFDRRDDDRQRGRTDWSHLEGGSPVGAG